MRKNLKNRREDLELAILLYSNLLNEFRRKIKRNPDIIEIVGAQLVADEISKLMKELEKIKARK
jgi:hypothetical protein